MDSIHLRFKGYRFLWQDAADISRVGLPTIVMLNAMLLSAVKVWAENGGREPAGALYEILKSNLAIVQRYL